MHENDRTPREREVTPEPLPAPTPERPPAAARGTGPGSLYRPLQAHGTDKNLDIRRTAGPYGAAFRHPPRLHHGQIR